MQDTIITQLQHQLQQLHQLQHQFQHQFQQLLHQSLQHQLQHDHVVEVQRGSTKQVVKMRNKLSDSAMDNMQSRC